MMSAREETKQMNAKKKFVWVLLFRVLSHFKYLNCHEILKDKILVVVYKRGKTAPLNSKHDAKFLT